MKFNIPECPKSWHFIGHSKNFNSKKAQAVKIFKKEYLIYRTTEGKLVAMKNACPHMGARLSDGEIKNDRVVCPFHRWEFNEKGKCDSNPFTECSIKNIKAATYPIEERHGLVFLFNDIKASYPLPFFDGLNPNDYYCDEGTKIYQEVMWHVAPSNAFDCPHFKYVHKRDPVKNSEISFPSPYSCHIEHEYLISGNVIADRFLRLFYGKKCKLVFTSFGGGLIFARSQFGNFENAMFFYLQPTEDNKSVSHLFTYKKKDKYGIISEIFHRLITMKMRSHFSRIFFQKEATELTQINYQKSKFHYLDNNLVTYLNWLHTVNKPDYVPGMEIEKPLSIYIQEEDERKVPELAKSLELQTTLR